ncbi:MAG: hypothetical protein MSB08_00155 [Subdoligranulum sp.]|nr:hypothetical protein [Subdoligranulum sp.]
MKINIFPLIFSAVCALCTACSFPSQAAAAQTSSSPQAELVALQSGGVNWGASTQDGFYYVNTKARKDGSCNLMYADYKSEQVVYLCSQANCAHDSASCTSYLMPTPGGVLPERVGDKIILFYKNYPWSDESGGPARVETINFDGSERQTIHTFRPEESPYTTMVTDGQNIYFVLETVQKDSSVRKNLAKLDTLTGDLELLQEMSVENSEYIWGCCGEDLIVYQCEMQDNRCTYQLSRWNFRSDHRDVIYTWKSGFPILYENSLALKGDDGYFHLLDLKENTDFTFTQYTTPESCSSNIVFADSEGIVIRELAPTSANTASARFFSLTKDGKTTDFSLVMDDDGDKNIFQPVYTLNDHEYLVYAGDELKTNFMTDPDGTSQFVQIPCPLFSIISKSDFYSSIDTQRLMQYHSNK